MRAMYPKRRMTSVRAGRRRYLSCVKKLLPSGALALTGSRSSQSPKTRIRMIPLTN